MSAVYSKSFWVAPSTGSADGPVVPTGRVWVITNMVCVPVDTSANNVLYVGVKGLVSFWGLALPASPNAETFFWAARVVLTAGQQLTAAVAGGKVHLLVSGYDFSAA